MKRLLLVLLLFAGTAQAELSLDLSQWLPPAFPNAAKVPAIATWVMPYANLLGFYFKRPPTIFVLYNYEDAVIAHEAGHAIWYNDLTWRQRRAWAHIHWAHPNLKAVAVYPDDPWHSFAEAFADYVTKPRKMLRNDPDVYEWFRQLSGPTWTLPLDRKDSQ